jgi:hypothetical protein
MTPTHPHDSRSRLAAIALALLAMAASACTDPGDTTDPKNSRTDPDATTTTTVDERADDRAAVIAGREAAYAAKWASLAGPTPNEHHPALADTMLNPRLLEAQQDAKGEARIGSHYRPGPQSKVIVQSVAFAGPDVAYLETCEVYDAQVIVNKTGKVNDFRSGTATIQRSEEMRRDAGRWKLVYSWVNTHNNNGGVTGCATETPPKATPAKVSDADRQAVTTAREAAERDWLAALINPAAPPPTGTHTGVMLEWFGTDPEDEHLLGRGGTLLRQECPTIWKDAENYGSSDPACVRRVWDGHAGSTYVLHKDGVAMAPNSTATVATLSVAFPDVETPQVAYLRTCRTYHVTRADGTSYNQSTHPDAIPNADTATVRTTEVMRKDGDAWKLAARWDFNVDLNAGPCA